MKLLVLVNPASNGGRARRKWRRYAIRLPAHDTVILNDIEQARTLAAKAVGYDAVVACGGDGTINAVADGVLKNPDLNLKFGVLYAGTSPDFCTFHRIPTEPQAAAACLMRGNTREVEVLTANGNHFFCSCNLGMGANVAAQSNRLRPLLGNRFGTFCALVWNLLTFRRKSYVLNNMEIPECDHLLITRMPYIAGGLKLKLPELQPGEYAVWFLQKASFLKRLLLPWKLYRGHPVGAAQVFTGPARITAESGGDIEYDGDPHGSLPLDIRVSERTLKLITEDNPMPKKPWYYWFLLSTAPCLYLLSVFLLDLAGWIRSTPSFRATFLILFLLLCLVSLVKASAYFLSRLQSKLEKVFSIIALLALLVPYALFSLFAYSIATFVLVPYRVGNVYYVDTSPQKTWRAITTTGPGMCFTITLQNLKNKETTPFTIHTRASVVHNVYRKWIDDSRYEWNSSDVGTITFTCENKSLQIEPAGLLNPGFSLRSDPKFDGVIKYFTMQGLWVPVPEPSATQKE